MVGQDLRAPTTHPISMGGEEINSPRQEGRGVSTRGNRVGEGREVHVCVVGAEVTKRWVGLELGRIRVEKPPPGGQVDATRMGHRVSRRRR